LRAQASLDFFPDRHGALELRFSVTGEARPAFAPVFAEAPRYPAAAPHDSQGAGESCAIRRKDFASLAPGSISGARQYLEDREWRAAQACSWSCVNAREVRRKLPHRQGER
jgi:hypothetical protein